MRKYILATLFFIIFVLCLEPAEKLLSKFIFVEEPQYHQIGEGEWLSKIAVKYYGDSSYWRELVLINRAPNGNRIYPGETIIIPSYDAIQKIRQTKRLSGVNDLIANQEKLIAQAKHETVPEFETAEVEVVQDKEPVRDVAPEVSTSLEDETLTTSFPADNEDMQEAVINTSPSINKALFIGVIALCAAFVIGIIFYIKRRKKEDVEYYGEVKDVEKEEFEKDDEEDNLQNFRNKMSFEPATKDSVGNNKRAKVDEKEFVS